MAKSRRQGGRSAHVVSVDRMGRLRIGGRFASKRQVGAVKGALSKRGRTLVIKRDRPYAESTIKRKRSIAARKAVVTKRLKVDGIGFVSEQHRKTTDSDIRSWFVPFNSDIDILRSMMADTIERALMGELGLVLVYPVLEAITTDDAAEFRAGDSEAETIHISKSRGFYRNARDTDIVENLIGDLGLMSMKYQLSYIVGVHLMFEFGR